MPAGSLAMRSSARMIWVPGMKPKPEPERHQEQLWRCLLEGLHRLDTAFADRFALEPECFRVAGWNHLFYGKYYDLALDLPGIDELMRKPGPNPLDLDQATSWRNRIARWIYQLGDAFPFLIEAVADPNMKATMTETRRYFKNVDGIASGIRELLKDEIQAAWDEGREVLLIGHSLGSVIAFDTLWEMTHRDWVVGRIDQFLSIGSPLGLNFVQRRLLGREAEGSRRYPGNIRRWVNIAAIGELTALDRRFADDFEEMRGLGLVETIEDHTDLYNFYRGPDGLNVHKSYGYLVNPVVAQVIHDWWTQADESWPGAGGGPANG